MVPNKLGFTSVWFFLALLNSYVLTLPAISEMFPNSQPENEILNDEKWEEAPGKRVCNELVLELKLLISQDQ
jgi:hypothetical protein